MTGPGAPLTFVTQEARKADHLRFWLGLGTIMLTGVVTAMFLSSHYGALAKAGAVIAFFAVALPAAVYGGKGAADKESSIRLDEDGVTHVHGGRTSILAWDAIDHATVRARGPKPELVLRRDLLLHLRDRRKPEIVWSIERLGAEEEVLLSAVAAHVPVTE